MITELRQRSRSRGHSEKYPPSVSYVGQSLYYRDGFVWRCRTHGAIVVSIWKIEAFGGKIVVTREAAIEMCLLAFRTVGRNATLPCDATDRSLACIPLI